MKANWNYIIIFILGVVFFSCNKLNNKNESIYNGIDHQILNIVDSMDIHDKERSFITIWFYSKNDSNYVDFINSVPIAMDGSSITEWSLFSGYKKYNYTYLVFIQNNESNKFDTFVKKDSINFDDKPFEVLKTMDSDMIIEPVKKVYFINDKDSLILIKEEYI